MILVFIILAILLWAMSDVAWQEGRPKWAWVYLCLSAMHGALIMNLIL
jgi:hypothetical protein